MKSHFRCKIASHVTDSRSNRLACGVPGPFAPMLRWGRAGLPWWDPPPEHAAAQRLTLPSLEQAAMAPQAVHIISVYLLSFTKGATRAVLHALFGSIADIFTALSSVRVLKLTSWICSRGSRIDASCMIVMPNTAPNRRSSD